MAVLPFLTQRYAVRAAEIVSQTPSENVRAYDEMVRQVVSALTAGFGGDTVNLLMAHLTCIGGTFGGGERSAQSIFEYSVPASDLPGLDALRRAGAPAPAAVAARGLPGALLRFPDRHRLRRAGQHQRGVPGRGESRRCRPG